MDVGPDGDFGHQLVDQAVAGFAHGGEGRGRAAADVFGKLGGVHVVVVDEAGAEPFVDQWQVFGGAEIGQVGDHGVDQGKVAVALGVVLEGLGFAGAEVGEEVDHRAAAAAPFKGGEGHGFEGGGTGPGAGRVIIGEAGQGRQVAVAGGGEGAAVAVVDELAEDGVHPAFVQVPEFGEGAVGAAVAPAGEEQHGIQVQYVAVGLGRGRVVGEGIEFGDQQGGDFVAVGVGQFEGGEG